MSRETYSHIGKIKISAKEQDDIKKLVKKQISIHRFFSLNDIDITELGKCNPELSKTALHNAVYRLCLCDSYDKYGNIVTLKGTVLNASMIMEDYCRNRDKCTLNELIAFEKELCGASHRWLPMNTAYSVMVRVQENLFISEKDVNFDIEKIDKAIELFCVGDYIPLKMITSFSAFPYAGYQWNLFLLESFVRRFSRKFRFEVLAVNSKNAGAIVRKTRILNYHQIMANALAQSGIVLLENTTLIFLFEKGYIGRRSLAGIAGLIEEARKIRAGGR
ncbi:MAG: hypothetical protein LBR10_11130 [Prevotellaceae bacterium]|nr:hypothetical protein [Prevotellaceae bacterium]